MKIKKFSLKRFTFFCTAMAALMLTSCAENAESTSVNNVTEITSGTSESFAADDTSETALTDNVKTADITDEQLKELYDYAYKTVWGKEFLKDANGNFLTEEGKNLDEYKEEFKQTFTDRYADEYFKLEKGGTYFRGDSQFLEFFVLREENSVEDISVFGGYSGIWVGFGDKGSDISVRDNELTVTSRSDGKIVLTMTVWHVDPENELKVGEDYAYRLENGNLVIAGKFGGWDDNSEQIVIDDELSGTIADVPVGSDISEFYQKHYTDYLVKYDYNLILDDGVWKFDNFYIWD